MNPPHTHTHSVQGLKDVDYCVGAKTVMERLLGIEFFDALGKCVFYKSESINTYVGKL